MLLVRARFIFVVVGLAIVVLCSCTGEASESELLKFGDVEVEVLGWQTVTELPTGVRVKPEQKLVGVSYFAVNKGTKPSSFGALSLKLRTDKSEKDHRSSLIANAILGTGAMGGQLLPGEPLTGTLYYKVDKGATKFTWVRGRRKESQLFVLPSESGVRKPSAAMIAAVTVKPTIAPAACKVDGWTIVVESARSVDAILGEKPSAGTRGVSITVRLTNNGDETVKLALVSTTLVKTPSGKVHSYRGDPTVDAQELARNILKGGKTGLTVEAGPGASVTTHLGFFVPKDESELWLVIDPSESLPGKALITVPAAK